MPILLLLDGLYPTGPVMEQCRLMIWDGRSKGTLNNILNLLKLDKKVLVYFDPTSNCYTVTSYRDLLDLLVKCDEDARQNFEKYFSLAELSVLQPVEHISAA